MTQGDELEAKIYRYAEIAGPSQWQPATLDTLASVLRVSDREGLVHRLHVLHERGLLEMRQCADDPNVWNLYHDNDPRYFDNPFEMRPTSTGITYFQSIPAERHPKAFVSHSTQDHEFVMQLATDLMSNGVEVWYSGWEIKAGDSIRRKIEEGLAGCDYFLIILSTKSVNAPWVRTELDIAAMRFISGEVKKIIPVKIEPCGTLPLILSQLCWVDFSMPPYESALHQLLDSIHEVVLKPPLLHRLLPKTRKRLFQLTHKCWLSMMSLPLALLPSLITHPAIQLLTGGVLAWLVWKFFEGVDRALTDETKIEIALWLVGVETASKVKNWTGTFARLFNRVFGTRHFSWTCFWRSCAASLMSSAICVGGLLLLQPMLLSNRFTPKNLVAGIGVNVVVGYFALLKTRTALRLLQRSYSLGQEAVLSLLDVYLTGLIGSASTLLALWAFSGFRSELVWPGIGRLLELQPLWIFDHAVQRWDLWALGLCGLPIVLASVWVWLYVVSGILLKATFLFDFGFGWFYRKFDIEKKPLQSIGLVAGALVAVVYWAAVIVSRMVG